jgi:N-terminal acetyltransferase B complex non-catalytic subunit
MVAPCACIICSTPCSSYCGICLTALALGTLKSYGTAIANETNIKTTLLSTDRHPADDLCILSAMCLIKLAVSTEMNSGTLNGTSAGHWLRASIILEYGWSQSKSNFQISLLLVRMYSHIGCGSLAMRAYQRLNVKQVQHDTLSHNIFDQLSTLHPHSFDHNPDNSSTLRSPLEQFKDHEKFYRNAPNQINKNIWRAFQLGSYNSIFQLVDLRQHLLNSMTKVMSIVERRRIARLVEPSTLTKNGSDILCTFTLLLNFNRSNWR